EQGRRATEVGEVLRSVEGEDRGRGRPRIERGPTKGHGIFPFRNSRRIRHRLDIVSDADVRVLSDRGEVPAAAGDDRAVHGRADLQLDVVSAGDFDRLCAHLKRLQYTVTPVRITVDDFDVEVGDVSGEVRESPSDAVIVSDDDARETRECETR